MPICFPGESKHRGHRSRKCSPTAAMALSRRNTSCKYCPKILKKKRKRRKKEKNFHPAAPRQLHLTPPIDRFAMSSDYLAGDH